MIEQPVSHKTPAINSQQNEHCFCYTNDGNYPHVSNVLEYTNFGFERLVVYFYKDLFTQKLAMYIPNRTKQYLIPEPVFEPNDVLTYPSSTETIQNLVDMGIQKTIILGVVDAHKSTITSLDETPSVDHEFVVNLPGDINSDIVEKDGQPINKGLSEDVPHNSVDVQVPVVVQEDAGNYAPMALTEIMNTGNDDMANAELNVVHVLRESTTNAPGIPLEHASSNNAFISYTKESQNSNKQIEDTKNMYKWIEKQILNHSGDLNTIDVEALTMLILQILIENEINVSPDGLLTDIRGSLLDPSNLIIKPILLDSSVSYDHLLQKLLKGYIISLKNPPKVLGIIPFVKTYVPKPVRYSVIHDKKATTPNYTSRRSNGGCSKGKCFSDASGKKTRRDTSKLDYRIIPGRLDEDQESLELNRRLNNFAYKTPVSQVIPNIGYPEGNEKIMLNIKDDSILQTKFNRIPSKILDTITNLILYQKDHEEDTVEAESDADINEEGPGIRIVGGSAATGSGTPVSNRGRSGGVPDDLD